MTLAARTVLSAIALAVALLSTGCGSTYVVDPETPIDFQSHEPIGGPVVLVIDARFAHHSTKYDVDLFRLGPALAANAERLAHHLFEEVTVVSEVPAAPGPAPVLYPRVVLSRLSVLPVVAVGENYHFLLQTHWELRDAGGNVVWSAPIDGSGHANILTIFDYNTKRRQMAEDAVRTMFMRAAAALSQSAEARAATARHTVGEGGTG